MLFFMSQLPVISPLLPSVLLAASFSGTPKASCFCLLCLAF